MPVRHLQRVAETHARRRAVRLELRDRFDERDGLRDVLLFEQFKHQPVDRHAIRRVQITRRFEPQRTRAYIALGLRSERTAKENQEWIEGWRHKGEVTS